jgi:tetratricopeptide (TPR) repeat protein
MEIADALPQNTIALRETAAALHLRIADIIRSVTERERRNEFGDQLQSIFALSLNSLGNRLSELGRREDARAAAQEANGIYRRLAAARPDAFLPNLALSLNNLGNRLSELRRREDALAAAQEAMTTLAPYFLKSPQAYAQWMSVMARGYSERCEESGVEPDPILLGPIAEGLRKLQAKPDAEPASDA